MNRLINEAIFDVVLQIGLIIVVYQVYGRDYPRKQLLQHLLYAEAGVLTAGVVNIPSHTLAENVIALGLRLFMLIVFLILQERPPRKKKPSTAKTKIKATVPVSQRPLVTTPC